MYRFSAKFVRYKQVPDTGKYRDIPVYWYPSCQKQKQCFFVLDWKHSKQTLFFCLPEHWKWADTEKLSFVLNQKQSDITIFSLPFFHCFPQLGPVLIRTGTHMYRYSYVPVLTGTCQYTGAHYLTDRYVQCMSISCMCVCLRARALARACACVRACAVRVWDLVGKDALRGLRKLRFLACSPFWKKRASLRIFEQDFWYRTILLNCEYLKYFEYHLLNLDYLIASTLYILSTIYSIWVPSR